MIKVKVNQLDGPQVLVVPIQIKVKVTGGTTPGADAGPLGPNLAAIAAMDSAVPGMIASEGTGFIPRTFPQVKGLLGMGNVDNTADAAKPVSALQQAAIDAVIATLVAHLGDLANPHAVTKAQVGLGAAENTSDANKPTSIAQQASIDAAVALLRDGVAAPGDTLQKLYNLILGASSEVYVANIAARDAYNIPHLPFSIFVIDDGDTRWAKYQATTTGVGATFVKLSDPDLLNAVMSAAAIKVAYESNADTNALTNALLAKLNGIETAADVTDAGNVGAAINSVADKAVPADGDKFSIWDLAGAALKTVTWANIKSYFVTITGNQNVAGIKTFTDKTVHTHAVDDYQGADIASAATTDIGAGTGKYLVITGSVGIGAFGVCQKGVTRYLTFAAAPLITHNAVSLQCLTGGNVQAAAGDRCTMISLGAGNWQMYNYQRADGTGLAGGSSTLTKSVTPTSGFTDEKLLKSVSGKLEQASLFSELAGTQANMAGGYANASYFAHYAFMSRNGGSGIDLDGGSWGGIDSYGRRFFGSQAANSTNQWTYNRFGQRNAITTLNANAMTLARGDFHVAVNQPANTVLITLQPAANCWDATYGVGQKYVITDKGCNASAFNITVQRDGGGGGTDAVITNASGSNAVLNLNGGRMEIECISATEWKVNIYA